MRFFRSFRRQRAAQPQPEAQVPAGLRIYAIGDVHGRADLLGEAADWIAADVKDRSGDCKTIFLGDYVDRGPGSAAVVDRLSRGDFPTRVEALRGNHEDLLLRFLDDAAVLADWRALGALATLQSYGVPASEAQRGRNYAQTRDAFLAKLPQGHLEFLRATQLSASAGDYFFCHAGVRPGVALERQSADDLLWIREEFLSFRGSFGKRVVHGHSPVAAPDVRANRINIDTGAYATSALTCVALEGAEVRLFTTRRL